MDNYTRVPKRIKEKWKARETMFIVVAWLVSIVAFLYLVGFIAEQFSTDWP